ncbi:MAG: citrate lyase holo-[acyl-carrier protein] synthase, partial [Candidatus Caldatribacteriota bacterium]|nr:citrate lyase holo-[acyl-carrier protein] synthase [Candidatus Caldatribacteriota bacterium]
MIELNNFKDNRLENINAGLQEILRAREERVINQRKLLKKYHLPILSTTLNIPGPEKNNDKIRKIFYECLRVIKIELKKDENTKIIYEKVYFTADGPESFLIVKGLSEKNLKKIAIGIEDNHPFGRLFDIDVLSKEGHKVCRKDVNKSLRKCIICNDFAIHCITSRKHNRKEIIETTYKMIDDFSAQSFDYWVNKIGGIALKSILLELNCTPKPGLVDKFNNGANQDMNFTTFISSSAAIAYGIYQFVRLGIDHTGKIEEILPHLRKIGIGMENNMFEATGGINTQKGLIFLEGLVCTAAGFLIKEGKKLSPEYICQKIKKICKGIVDKELKILPDFSLRKKLTNGERLFLKYGISGIRGEAERGFPTVREKGLPTLRA